MTQQPARSTGTGLGAPGSQEADSGTSGPQNGAERIGSGMTLTEAERQERAAKCDCGHRPIWHHDERGCGYYGFSDNRCACLLTSDAVVESIVAARVAAALAEVAALRQQVAEVEAERDEWRDVSVGPAYATLLRERAQAAEAEAAHYRATFFAACPKDHQHGVWCGSDWVSLKARAEDAKQTVAAQARVIEQVRALREVYALRPVVVLSKSDTITDLDAALAAAPTPPAEAEEVDQ